MTKPAERAQARELRRAGMPYKRIAAQLKVSVSSAYLWTKDIELTPEQRQANLRGPNGPLNPDAQRRRTESWITRSRERRAVCQEDGRSTAREGDPLHLAGCMLYWAEGGKSKGSIQFSNSDPRMVRLFRRFLTASLGIELQKVLISLNVYTNNGLSIEEIERYWLELLGLPRSSVRKHTLNHRPTSSSGRAKNKLPYGVCTLWVNNTWMLQHILGAIQEYAGFEEPSWLR